MCCIFEFLMFSSLLILWGHSWCSSFLCCWAAIVLTVREDWGLVDHWTESVPYSTGMWCALMYSTVLCCTVPYQHLVFSKWLYCTQFYFAVLSWTILTYCIMYCYNTVLLRNELYSLLNCPELCRILKHCSALWWEVNSFSLLFYRYRTALHPTGHWRESFPNVWVVVDEIHSQEYLKEKKCSGNWVFFET